MIVTTIHKVGYLDRPDRSYHSYRQDNMNTVYTISELEDLYEKWQAENNEVKALINVVKNSNIEMVVERLKQTYPYAEKALASYISDKEEISKPEFQDFVQEWLNEFPEESQT